MHSYASHVFEASFNSDKNDGRYSKLNYSIKAGDIDKGGRLPLIIQSMSFVAPLPFPQILISGKR